MESDEDFKQWRSSASRNSRWAKEGVDRSKGLRRSGDAKNALAYLNEILKSDASNRMAANLQLWCCYDIKIKDTGWSTNYEQVSSAAEWITSRCDGDLNYTPYVHTCLRVAGLALQADNSVVECQRWLEKIDAKYLTDDVFSYTDSEGKKNYWSKRRRYLEINVLSHECAADYKKAIWLALVLDRTCRSSPEQREEIVQKIGALAHRAYRNELSESKEFAISDSEDECLLDLILIKRGFLSDGDRVRYKDSLIKKNLRYSHWDKETDKAVWVPNFEKIIYVLLKELYIQAITKVREKKSKRSISATDLSAYAFCPASYSIQKTYDTLESEIGNLGEALHDKRMLVSKKVEQTRERMFGIASKNRRATYKELGVSETIWEHISSLMREISTAEVNFCGHSGNEKTFFSDSSDQFVGAPDYIFERRDGQRFVVEEKFSLQKPASRWITTPFDNHVAQVVAYISLIDEIKADYGYLLYWTFSIGDNGRPYIRSAQSFKVVPSDDLIKWARSVVGQIRSLHLERSLKFELENLNPWKCVNCVHSELCNHKTGQFERVSWPYTEEIPIAGG